MQMISMHKKNMQRGFTAIELVVVIAIFGILSSVVLIRFSTFTQGVNIFNTTQDIALRIKQAQNSAILGQYPKTSAHAVIIDDIANWKPKYGVYFDLATPEMFSVFFDENTNDVYDNPLDGSPCTAVDGECIDEIRIAGSQQELYRICAGDDCSVEKVALMFQRPFPDLIATDNGAQNGSPTLFNENIRIVLKSGNDTETTYRMITITPLGQISVSNVAIEDINTGVQGPGIN